MTEDEQEALSNRYVDALRIVQLSSGRWAIFPLASAIHPIICEKLDEELCRKMLSEQRERDARVKEQIEQRLQRPLAPGKKTISLEELGLL